MRLKKYLFLVLFLLLGAFWGLISQAAMFIFAFGNLNQDSLAFVLFSILFLPAFFSNILAYLLQDSFQNNSAFILFPLIIFRILPIIFGMILVFLLKISILKLLKNLKRINK